MSNRQLPRFRMIEYGDCVTISDYAGIIEDFDMGPRTEDAAFVLQAMNELHERREAERKYSAENAPNEILPRRDHSYITPSTALGGSSTHDWDMMPNDPGRRGPGGSDF